MQRRLKRRSKLFAFFDQLLVAVTHSADCNHVFAHLVTGFFQRFDAAGQNSVIHAIDKVDALVTVCRNRLGSTFITIGLTKTFVYIIDDFKIRPGNRFFERIDRKAIASIAVRVR